MYKRLFLFFFSCILFFACVDSTPPLYYTISFNSYGGSSVPQRSVSSGELVSKPTDPVRSGYSFTGWYEDSALTQAWDFTVDTVTTDLTLYAGWSVVIHTVSFDSNGGSSVAEQSVNYGALASGPVDPVRSGCTFTGWYEDSDLTQAWDFTVDTVTTDLTLYAGWSVVIHTVSFDSNGGSSVAAQSVTYGALASGPVDPVRSGYTFTGWYEDSALTQAWDFTVDTVTTDLTLYAGWSMEGFVTLWDMSKTETNTLDFPLDEAGTYDFTINWGDGTSESYTSASVSHTYTADDRYTVQIIGTCEGFGFPLGISTDHPNRENLTDVVHWGGVRFHNEGYYFYKCTNLTGFSASDAPDLTGITNLRFAFNGASSFNDDLTDWDTSDVTLMYDCFGKATVFNGDISTWDTGLVTDMDDMFREAAAFNGDLSGWDTGLVEDMAGMFCKAAAFNGDIREWDTGSVTTMENMFYEADAFTRDLNWDTSQVTSMLGMFCRTDLFNGNITGWTTTKVETMKSMFYMAASFDRDISGWDLTSAAVLDGMFYQTSVFNQDLSDWDVSSVLDMDNLFCEAAAYDNGGNPAGLEDWTPPTDNPGYSRAYIFNGSPMYSEDKPSWY